MTNTRIAQLIQYPLKSGAPQRIHSANVSPTQFHADRQLMVVGWDDHAEEWVFVAQRSHKGVGLGRPLISIIKVTEQKDSFSLQLHRHHTLYELDSWRQASENETFTARLWDDRIEVCEVAPDLRNELGMWLEPDERCTAFRLVTPAKAQVRKGVANASCADQYSMHLMTLSTARAVGAWANMLDTSVWTRYRPNILLGGGPEPFSEETCKGIVINGTFFQNRGRTKRCLMPNMLNGIPTSSKQPLLGMTKARSALGLVPNHLGIHLTTDEAVTISVDDDVELIF